MHESESVMAARPLVLSVGEAATLLGISRAHAYELVARGELVDRRRASATSGRRRNPWEPDHLAGGHTSR
ncbi:MAG: helix-turn-helix domain-containing protein [Acidimicrobiia bacterium]